MQLFCFNHLSRSRCGTPGGKVHSNCWLSIVHLGAHSLSRVDFEMMAIEMLLMDLTSGKLALSSRGEWSQGLIERVTNHCCNCTQCLEHDAYDHGVQSGFCEWSSEI